PLQGFPILYTRYTSTQINSQANTTQTIPLPIQEPTELPRANAIVQKEIYDQINESEKKHLEFTSFYSTTSDFQLHRDLHERIKTLKSTVKEKKSRFENLKRNANYQQKWDGNEEISNDENQKNNIVDRPRTVLHMPFPNGISIEEPCSIGRQDQPLAGEMEVVAVLI
ncbi:13703_t:CDS:2, partial [Gigaspora rosea]